MTTPKLLTRTEFRESVFARDNHKCVFCDEPAVDAHHIIERRLFGESQGYYIDNGASVCGFHHLQCEKTLISVEEVREACGITRVIVPQHLYADQPYDKWGNPILEDGVRRGKGELFYDGSVQKVLHDVLDRFTPHVKYPRTHHLPWSPGVTDDDRVIHSMAAFENVRVIVTEKMDGENTSLYNNYTHARSIDSRSHPTRDWVKGFWSNFGYDIPEGWRVCGENLYAKHSIEYTDLPTYFMGFSIWDDRNTCLSWDSTLEWFQLLGITPVPILYDGIYDEKLVKSLWDQTKSTTHEGYVIRVADSFTISQFRTHVGKFVRAGHVQTSKHWMRGQRIIPNRLASNN